MSHIINGQRGARWTALLIATVAILLSGCALAWPFPQPTPDPKLPDAQQIFRALDIASYARDLVTLDPALMDFPSDRNLAQLIFPQLVTLDEHNKPMDWAAERHEISADGLTYTFHLRQGMVWSDGTPIDANTFAYALNRALDPCTGSDVASYLYNIKGAHAFNDSRCAEGATKSLSSLIGASLLVPDPLTFQVLLERPAGSFLSALTTPVSWGVPRTLVERYAAPPDPTHPHGVSTWTDHLLDNGPFGGNLFTLTSWQHHASSPDGLGHLAFARNERFWGQKLLLKEIQYTLYKDTSAEWSAYVTGGGDAGLLGPGDLDIARNLNGSTLYQTPHLALRYLALDWRVAPFDDKRMRQAFALALDRQMIAHDIYHDTVQPTMHFLPQGLVGYNADLVDAVGRTGDVALAPDVATAQRLANEYAADHCGGLLARCPPLNYFNQYPSGTPIALADARILAQLQAAFPGWRMAFYEGCHIQVCVQQPFHIMPFSLSAYYADPQEFLSELWTTTAPYNRDAVSIPQVDTLCAQADGLSDLAARIPLYQQAEQLLVAQSAAIPLFQSLDVYALRSRVVNWRIASSGQTPLSVWQTTYIRR